MPPPSCGSAWSRASSCCSSAQTLRGPLPGTVLPPAVSAAVPQSARSYTSMEVLRSPAFWLLYLMFVLVSSSGLMATAQLAPIAKDFGLSDTAILFGATTLSVALVVDNVMNGLARPFFGAVSDRIGREYTMALAFTLGALSYWLLALFGSSPWTFVICAALIFFTWGEIFSLFPSTCTDLFGTKYATANSMMLYTAKGTSAFLVPFANILKTATGSWEAVFLVGGRDEHRWWCCWRCSCCCRSACATTACSIRPADRAQADAPRLRLLPRVRSAGADGAGIGSAEAHRRRQHRDRLSGAGLEGGGLVDHRQRRAVFRCAGEHRQRCRQPDRPGRAAVRRQSARRQSSLWPRQGRVLRRGDRGRADRHRRAVDLRACLGDLAATCTRSRSRIEGLALNALATVLNGAWSAVLIRTGRRLRSPALLADGRHLLADVVTSVGVAIGVGLVVLTGYLVLDPLLAAATGVYVLWSGHGDDLDARSAA